MIDAALSERCALNPSGSLHAIARIKREGGGDVLRLGDHAPQRARILDRLSRALCEEWDHRMSRIADQRRAPERERRNWRTAVERPSPPLDGRAYQRARFLGPSRERTLKS